jgi:hypothetical protein
MHRFHKRECWLGDRSRLWTVMSRRRHQHTGEAKWWDLYCPKVCSKWSALLFDWNDVWKRQFHMGRYNPTSSNSPRPTARKTHFLSIMSGEGDSRPRQLILDNVIESKITKMDAVGMLRLNSTLQNQKPFKYWCERLDHDNGHSKRSRHKYLNGPLTDYRPLSS